MTTVVLDGQSLRPDHVAEIAAGARVVLEGGARARMSANADAFATHPSVLRAKRRYLVGPAPVADADLVPTFILGHCSGVGESLPAPIVRAMMACRANVLAAGASGVRPEAADALLALLNAGITPIVPSQGSVGAAGDLAPLAHVARVLCGLGGLAALPDGSVGLNPLPAFVPTHKEALSLINGATLTSAIAAIAVFRAERVVQAMEVACAMSMAVLRSDTRCLSEAAAGLRGHAGGVRVAARIRAILGHDIVGSPDAFSIRAAPAVIGAARDALDFIVRTVTLELNGACDNPLYIDGGVIEGGNFHGAPVALAMDVLRIALTQAATQSERRTFRLTSGELSGDLPSFLVEGTGLNSGFMLAQYTAASLASECKGLAHPACVDSIPTVQHHEDHVSMGPIAGRLALRTLECVADIVAIEVLLAAQGLEFRRDGVSFRDGVRTVGTPVRLSIGVEAARAAVRAVTPRWHDDQHLHPAMAAVGQLVRAGKLTGAGVPW